MSAEPGLPRSVVNSVDAGALGYQGTAGGFSRGDVHFVVLAKDAETLAWLAACPLAAFTTRPEKFKPAVVVSRSEINFEEDEL